MLSLRLGVLAALAAFAVLGARSANADHQGAIAQFVNNFGDGIDAGTGAGDNQWHNPANWNNHGPPSAAADPRFAFINVSPAHDTTPPKQGGPATVSVPGQSAAEVYIGQGAGDGEVLVTTGGQLTVSTHIHVARDAGRNGLFAMDGGSTTASNLFLGHQGGTATAEITGGMLTITGDIRLSDSDASSSTTSSLSITGGNVVANLIGIGARTGGPGTGSLVIGGDADVTANQNIFMRPGSANSISVAGSQATINVLRGANATGFEVHTDTNTNFTFDASGISPVDLGVSNMRFSGLGTLNVDASAFGGTGNFDLFKFGDYHPTGIFTFGTENLTFAPGRSGSVLYNPNSIQLQIVPEPTSLGLLAIAAIALLLRQRKAVSQ